MSDAVMVPMGGGDVIALVDPSRWNFPDAPQLAYANGHADALAASTPVGGWPEREKDVAWLERQKEGGHCGESTSDAIQRGRINACIDRILSAIAAPPPPSVSIAPTPLVDRLVDGLNEAAQGRYTVRKVEVPVSIDNGSRPQEAVPGEQTVNPVLAFGHGRFVVDTGSYNQTPAVFICPVDKPGMVGASSRALGHDRHTLLPGEMVLTFPFFQQAEAVADALVTAPPTPQPADGCSSNDGADGWIEWSGGENPVPGETVECKIRWRQGEPSQGAAASENMDWRHRRKGHGEGGDIVSYRILPQTEKGS